MEGVFAVFVAFLFSAAQIPRCLSSPPPTVPAFLWSPHLHGSPDYGVKEIVNYRTIFPKDLAKSVLSEGGWSNVVCSGENLQQSVDIALIFVGRELHTSDISRNKQLDPALIDFLEVSFTKSNYSIAFPYVAASEEKKAMENSLISGFAENCGHGLGVNGIAFLDSCNVEGKDIKKLAGLQSVHDYIGSKMETRLEGQTDLIVFCNGNSQASEEFDLVESEGKIFSELINFLEQSGATYTTLYTSDPYRSLQDPSHRGMDRFLAEGTKGNGSADSTFCDEVCQIKASLLEGVLIGIVLLIILLSGLCCMMGIDTPTRFESPQDS
eukprot:TRINITY_DN8562_c0_g4_i1.p1 TRINITY_DN8562_c0_g4~~TRINITY_DN8562_c0_g4_i1.p1  ORF type:complete len:324 (-),score=51.88 TRINITY_DN8562_c0_g4_i1:377-1348(-)